MNLDEYTTRRKLVTTKFGDFAYVDAGDGPPAVFVHGLFVSGYLWRNVIEGIRDERRCIAYNLPAHGHSRLSADQDLSLGANADMLAAFCDALGFDKIDLVANDTGGAIAQVFTVRHPERVRTLTLTNCEARDVLPSPNELAQLIFSLASRGELAPLAMQMRNDLEMARGPLGLGPAFEHPERLSADDVRGYLEHQYSSLDDARQIERFVLALHADQLAAIMPDLAKLEVPTLAVWGTGDHIFDIALAYWLRDTIPGCREVIEVHGGKLFWPGERPDDLVPHLRRHWTASRRAAARSA